MKRLLCLVTVALAVAGATSPTLAQITSTSSGGAGGAGGSAAGGTATGGSATNNTSGVSSASGGQGGTASGGQGGTSTSAGGSSVATGGNVGTVSTGGSNAQLGDITVNYNLPATTVPMGKAGLGVGVDPITGAILTDSTVTYQGSYKLKNTPDVSVGGPASGPCNGFSGGFGVSMAGFAVGANTSTVDDGCSARETARVAAMIGRMDVANAILDNLPIVQAAMKAKAMREALALPAKTSEAPATNAPARFPAPVPVQTQEQREAALKEQQRLAQEALQRQATMAKTNDTLKFTDATTQASEKTPQEIMAEETTKKQLAAKAEEAKTLQAKSSPPSPAPQQTNTLEAQVTTAPLALQQAIRAEPIVPGGDRKSPPNTHALSNVVQTTKTEGGKAVEMRGPPPAPVSTEERVKAAKAALNLQ